MLIEYLKLGLEHILDPNGYDHILFILTLCVMYTYREWRPLLILVTAFTVGHSITLALATMRWVTVSTPLIEALIPLTILISSIFNVASGEQKPNLRIQYILTAVFGLIHGLGFSNFLRSMLGREESLFAPLLFFNVGLEIGQVAVVLFALLAQWTATTYGKLSRKTWILVISFLTGSVAIRLLLERLPAVFE
jgi:hypothetical protein